MKNTQYLIEGEETSGRVVTLSRLREKEAESLVKETKKLIKADYSEFSELTNAHFKYNPELFDGKGGIEGSSTYLMILANKALAGQGFLPGLREGFELDSRGLLENGVYRDYGIAVYSANGVNEENAKSLVKEAKERELELPLLIEPISLDITKGSLEIVISSDERGIISGKEAKEWLKKFNYKGNSGVQRLGRYGGGDWGASWDNLPDSYDGGRVDWIVASGFHENSEDRLFSDSESELLKTLRGVREGNIALSELDTYIEKTGKQ